MDLLCFCSVLCLLCLCASVYMCFVVTCWEKADLLALVCGVSSRKRLRAKNTPDLHLTNSNTRGWIGGVEIAKR